MNTQNAELRQPDKTVEFMMSVTADIASYRLRNFVAMNGIREAGYDFVTSIAPSGRSDVYFFSKHFFREDRSYSRQLKEQGAKVVFDMCDFHPRNDALYEHYEEMVGNADIVTCNTEAMKKIIKAQFGRDATVIPEPYEGKRGVPMPHLGDHPRMLWFGHQRSFNAVEDKLLDSKYRPLEIVAMEKPEWNTQEVYFTTWTKEYQMLAMFRCDVVIIPVADGPEWQVKSANRLINGLWSGRFVCAEYMPAYEEFSEFAWVGDIIEGIEWAKKNPEQVKERIEAGQRYIKENYDPQKIGRKWAELLIGELT